MIIVCDSEVKVDLSPLYVHDAIDTEVELCLFIWKISASTPLKSA
jgi:hypothetical protein